MYSHKAIPPIQTELARKIDEALFRVMKATLKRDPTPGDYSSFEFGIQYEDQENTPYTAQATLAYHGQVVAIMNWTVEFKLHDPTEDNYCSLTAEIRVSTTMAAERREDDQPGLRRDIRLFNGQDPIDGMTPIQESK